MLAWRRPCTPVQDSARRARAAPLEHAEADHRATVRASSRGHRTCIGRRGAGVASPRILVSGPRTSTPSPPRRRSASGLELCRA
eukprot:1974647-Alexandrium_andersonii.AAC.1